MNFEPSLNCPSSLMYEFLNTHSVATACLLELRLAAHGSRECNDIGLFHHDCRPASILQLFHNENVGKMAERPVTHSSLL